MPTPTDATPLDPPVNGGRSAAPTWGDYRRLCLRLAKHYDEVLGEPGMARMLEDWGSAILPAEFGMVLPRETRESLAGALRPYFGRAIGATIYRNLSELIAAGEHGFALQLQAEHGWWIDSRYHFLATTESAAAVERVLQRTQNVLAMNMDCSAFGIGQVIGVG